mmetsp:Transcript_42427/g.122716  ORF Transcript_42427/g.122716 Transcript_42427/m.122716 type:complete len:157 (-) Transcript_42427:59-529(-)
MNLTFLGATLPYEGVTGKSEQSSDNSTACIDEEIASISTLPSGPPCNGHKVLIQAHRQSSRPPRADLDWWLEWESFNYLPEYDEARPALSGVSDSCSLSSGESDILVALEDGRWKEVAEDARARAADSVQTPAARAARPADAAKDAPRRGRVICSL